MTSPRFSLSTFFAAILFAGTLTLSPLNAQNTSTSTGDSQDKDNHLPKEPKVLFWRLHLPAGKVTLDLTKVTTVAQHEYISDELFRVTELNIATTSDLLIRFYYLEKYIPLKSVSGEIIKGVADRIQQKAETIADTAGIEPIWRQVHKNYPTTTHARTVEYRLQSKDQINKIRKHIEAAWLAQISGTYEISISEPPQ